MENNRAIVQGFLALAVLAVASGPVWAEGITYEGGHRRDPFVPLNAEDASFINNAQSGVRLEGIIYDPGRRSMAILNGKAYQVGDDVGEAKVVNIQKDHVVISADGEEKKLWIREAEKN